jgi:hypothetical protein
MDNHKQQKVLDHFIGGGKLTVSDCFYMAQTHDLRRIVDRLRHNHPIADRWARVDGTKFKEYFMARSIQDIDNSDISEELKARLRSIFLAHYYVGKQEMAVGA